MKPVESCNQTEWNNWMQINWWIDWILINRIYQNVRKARSTGWMVHKIFMLCSLKNLYQSASQFVYSTINMFMLVPKSVEFGVKLLCSLCLYSVIVFRGHLEKQNSVVTAKWQAMVAGIDWICWFMLCVNFVFCRCWDWESHPSLKMRERQRT